MDIPHSYDEAVEALARAHAESDDTLEAIWHFPDPEKKQVRFVDVSDAQLPAEEDSVKALSFAPSADFPFRSAIALLTADDFGRMRSGELGLPDGWDVRTMHKVWPNGAS